ncbi:MAG TPA: hypothetical protein VFY92_06345, partial [Hyphomicrobiaceae bacterium]|nr:hypothetical protein [Hyphomicrobiaceae bacterium]
MGVSLAILLSVTCLANAQSLFGFRLLDFDGRNIAWHSASLGDPPVVTYAFVTSHVEFADARNCSSMVPLWGLLK